MAVTVAILTSHPSLLPCQLARLSGQLHLRPETARVSTVGIGTVSEGSLLLRRYAPAEAPRSLADPALGDPADALVYRAQLLQPSASVEEAGQPFRFQRWLFAQEGRLEAWPQVQAWVESELPPHLLSQVGVRTPGALAFGLFLKGMRDLERGDGEVAPSDAARLLSQVGRALAQRAASEGAAHAARLLLVATDARCLVASRLGAIPVHFRLLEGSAECSRCQLGPASRGREEAVRAHQQARAVVVATAPVPGAHWLELGDAQALAVGPNLQAEVL
jgi:glutamine amidotransferase